MTNTTVVSHQHTYNPNEASCIFGCGSWVGESGICPTCRDYSENVSMCDFCGMEVGAYDEKE